MIGIKRSKNVEREVQIKRKRNDGTRQKVDGTREKKMMEQDKFIGFRTRKQLQNTNSDEEIDMGQKIRKTAM